MTRSRWAGALVAVFVLVACGASSKAGGTGFDGPSGPGDETTIVIGPDGSSSVVVLPNDTAPTTTPRCPAAEGCVGGGGGGPAPAPAAIDGSGPPGSFAPGILSASLSSQVVVEIRTQSSAGPQQQSIDHLTSVLGSVTGKPVSVAQGPTISGGAKSWSADDLRSTGGEGAAQGGGRAVIHLLFVHGSFGGDNGVLGIAVSGDVAAVFIDQVNSSSTPLVGSGGIETAVVTHEVGHLLGLVDLYLHTGRQDPDHPGHSTNTNSVMYWAVESNLVANLLQGGPSKDFDTADLADLQTIHDGG